MAFSEEVFGKKSSDIHANNVLIQDGRAQGFFLLLRKALPRSSGREADQKKGEATVSPEFYEDWCKEVYEDVVACKEGSN